MLVYHTLFLCKHLLLFQFSNINYLGDFFNPMVIFEKRQKVQNNLIQIKGTIVALKTLIRAECSFVFA